METEMKVSLVNLTSTVLNCALILGIYTASTFGPKCGPLVTLFGYCTS